jgi:arsenate reductase
VLTFYHYPKCSTCRKARRWLIDNAIEHTSIDIVETPPSKATLKRIKVASGIEIDKLFNTSGESYRTGNFKRRLASMSEEDKFMALATDGKLIKRPLVVGENLAIVGFRPAEYEQRLR